MTTDLESAQRYFHGKFNEYVQTFCGLKHVSEGNFVDTSPFVNYNLGGFPPITREKLDDLSDEFISQLPKNTLYYNLAIRKYPQLYETKEGNVEIYARLAIY